MSDPEKNGGILKLIATIGAAVGFATAMTMGTIAANERADRADAKAEKAAYDLGVYREETAGRLARLETTQGENVVKVANLDATLQREMRLLDDKTRAEGQEIDKRLQSEIDLKLAPLVETAKQRDSWIQRIVRLEALAEKEPGK